MIWLVLLLVSLVAVVMWFLSQPQSLATVPGGVAVESALDKHNRLKKLGYGAYGKENFVRTVGVSTKPTPKFIHTVQSSTAMAWLRAFLESATKAGVIALPSVQQALGRPDASHWKYAEQSIGMVGPAASVVVPAMTAGALSTGALVAAPAAAVISLFTMLDALDKDIKKRIAEAEICLQFIEEFVRSVSIPPMALLNALTNLVPDSGEYSTIRGAGTAMDRTKEPGVGIVRDMCLLFDEVAKRGWMHGIPVLKNYSLYRKMIDRREIGVPLANNRTKLQPTGSGFSGYARSQSGDRVKIGGSRGWYWARYVYSTAKLFDRVEVPRWKWGYSNDAYKKALAGSFGRSGNPCTFDKQAMSDFLDSGGIYKGVHLGYIQPTIVNFSIGHQPGLEGYGGLDTGFAGIPLTNDTRPNFSENTWKARFDIDCNGGWVLV